MFSAVSLTDAAVGFFSGLTLGTPAGGVALVLTGSIAAALFVGAVVAVATGVFIGRATERDRARRAARTGKITRG